MGELQRYSVVHSQYYLWWLCDTRWNSYFACVEDGREPRASHTTFIHQNPAKLSQFELTVSDRLSLTGSPKTGPTRYGLCEEVAYCGVHYNDNESARRRGEKQSTYWISARRALLDWTVVEMALVDSNYLFERT